MYYREAGRLVSSFAKDRRMLPLVQDRFIATLFIVVVMYGVVTMIASDYWFSAILIPMMVLAIATLGLNIATGYTGQLSLGTAGFMCFGAFAAFNLLLRIDWMIIPLAFFLAGVIAGIVGVFFGLPSLRIKGFYLIVSTLAAQFFAEWVFNAYPWFLDYNSSGVANLPPHHYRVFPFQNMTPLNDAFWHTYQGRYLITLTVTLLLAIACKNMVRSSTGRNWMAVRDMDIAANVIGISVAKTKLMAFFISTFYCGVAGAMYCYCYIGNIDFMIFNLRRSFLVMFMVIVGGLGSILGSFLGAIFVYGWPILITRLGDAIFGGGTLDTAFVENNSKIVVGTIIIVLLIREPGGFAALWNTTKQKLRAWPFTK
ncbi:MAG: branched-chain amino acid ABC transporter permease [Pseudomonadota bacterium]